MQANQARKGAELWDMQDNRGQKAPSVRIARKELELAIGTCSFPSTIMDKLLDYMAAVTKYRAKTLHGEIRGAVSEEEGRLWWVIYQNDFGDYWTECYMRFPTLKYYVEAPDDYIPPDTLLGGIHVFGIQESFVKDVSDYVAKLLDQGIDNVIYYGWDWGSMSYIRHYASAVKYMVALAKNPALLKEYKQSIVNDNRVIPVEEMEYLRQVEKFRRKYLFKKND